LKENKKKTPEWFRRVVKLLCVILILFIISIGLIFVITGITPFISEKVYKLFGKTVVGTKNGWLGFYGGFLGGIISLVGIWWQITRKEKQDNKEKFEGLERYLSYVFQKNIEFKNKESVVYALQKDINYMSQFKDVPWREGYIYGEVYLPSSKFIEDNLKILMELKESGKELLEVIDDMNYFNQEIKFFNEFRMKNGEILYKVKDKVLQFPKNTLKDRVLSFINLIEQFSRVVIYYNRMDSNKKDLEMVKFFQNTIMKKCFEKYNTYNDGELYWSDLSKLENKFNELNLDERNIQTSIKLNEVLIEMVKELHSYLDIVEFKDNKTFEIELLKLSSNLLESTLLDERINGRLPILLKKIEDVYEKLEYE
jgi:hypothetical protein